MLKSISLIFLIILFGISVNQAYSQEIGLATFQETAQLIIDNKISQKTITSITLTSSNIQEIQIPIEFEQKIRENNRIQAVILTNVNNCVLGVNDQSCIIINIERNPMDKGINAIQESTREIGDNYIEELNEIFDTNAKFFQVYIHTDDEANQALDTSGIISGRGTISAVYTMTMEDTDSMYGKISSMLISKQIRESEGFYDIAKTLSVEENAKMTFSIIPTESKSILQLRLSVENPIEIQGVGTPIKISPLEFFKIKEISRSNYFSTGNYPLNSIFQVVILATEASKISEIKGNIIPTQIIDGMKIPTEITKEGWVFDPRKGEQMQGKYIFGGSNSINENKLKFSLSEDKIQETELSEDKIQETELDESIIVVIIIAIVSIGAAIFYLRGYKK
ncbi:hypothetical protein OAO63_02595 [Nitrosopumilus sp.]|nr:hypothetical protein [Nitrosopumilus sp.]